MAGEWLKFDASTPDKPEVLAITVAMGWDDPDLTVGKLLRVWRWFDQQTVDGNAHGVTAALLDRLIGVSGLCEAMAKVGWLDISDDGLSLPNFDRHNGKTAKDRALTAKRVANHKANAKGNGGGNGESVSGALPREEKRREEKKSVAKATSFCADAPEWVPSEEWADFVKNRKAMRNVPFTEAAAKGVIAELRKLTDAGHDPAELLQTAITNGWRTVYPPKTSMPSQPTGKHAGFQNLNYSAGVNADGTLA